MFSYLSSFLFGAFIGSVTLDFILLNETDLCYKKKDRRK